MTDARLPPQSSVFSPRHRLARLLWGVAWSLLFRPSPTPLHGWRRMLLRLFGARVAPTAHVYPSARVWAPWHLTLEDHACLGRACEVYCVTRVRLGARSTVSQYAYLCGAGHDHTRRDYPLTPGAIDIGCDCWIGADVFVGPGVTIGDGTVVGARSSVFGDLPPWVVAVGSPAKPVKPRVFADDAPP